MCPVQVFWADDDITIRRQLLAKGSALDWAQRAAVQWTGREQSGFQGAAGVHQGGSLAIQGPTG